MRKMRHGEHIRIRKIHKNPEKSGKSKKNLKNEEKYGKILENARQMQENLENVLENV